MKIRNAAEGEGDIDKQQSILKNWLIELNQFELFLA
jgi:hypothetical protein